MSSERAPATDAQPAADAHSVDERSKPACHERHRAAGRWVAKTYSERLAQFLRPCRRAECYPDGGAPDTDDRVIRVARGPNATVVHRPGPPARDDEPDTPEVPLPEEPLSAIGQLDVGDAVLWGARKNPLFVLSTEWPIAPEVTVAGPQGGRYILESHHDEFWATNCGRVGDVFYQKADPPDRS